MTSTISPHDTGEIAVDESTDVASLSHHDTDRTRNLTGYLSEGRLRRPDSTGEFPIYQPETFAIVDAEPAPDPAPAAVEPAQPEPVRYRGEHRREDPPWLWALVGAGTVLVGEALAAGAVVLAVAW